MVRTLLIQGMLVGALAGLLTLAFALIVGEPQVERAVAFEERSGAAHHAHDAAAPAGGEEPETALVSRGVQGTIGLATGVIVFGSAAGGLFALFFALAHGRLGSLSPRATAALLALAAFVVVYLVPALKYPPSPPAVGDPATIGLRTGLYFLMLACSFAAACLAVRLGARWVARFGAWNGALLAGGVFIALAAVAGLVLPAVNEVPDGFPADLLWRFRLASVGTQAVLWTGIGLLFGALAERSLGARPAGEGLAQAT